MEASVVGSAAMPPTQLRVAVLPGTGDEDAQNLRVSCINMRGLTSGLLLALAGCNMRGDHVCFMSETGGLAGKLGPLQGSGYELWPHRAFVNHRAGAGYGCAWLVRADVVKRVSTFTPPTGTRLDVAWLTVRVQCRNLGATQQIAIGGIYAPPRRAATFGQTLDELTTDWHRLQASGATNLVVMGDWNARFKADVAQDILGRAVHTPDTSSNANGRRLLEFVRAQALQFVFGEALPAGFTFFGTGRGQRRVRSVTDYMITTPRLASRIVDGAIDTTLVDTGSSDHALLWCETNIPLSRKADRGNRRVPHKLCKLRFPAADSPAWIRQRTIVSAHCASVDVLGRTFEDGLQALESVMIKSQSCWTAEDRNPRFNVTSFAQSTDVVAAATRLLSECVAALPPPSSRDPNDILLRAIVTTRLRYRLAAVQAQRASAVHLTAGMTARHAPAEIGRLIDHLIRHDAALPQADGRLGAADGVACANAIATHHTTAVPPITADALAVRDRLRDSRPAGCAGFTFGEWYDAALRAHAGNVRDHNVPRGQSWRSHPMRRYHRRRDHVWHCEAE